MDAGLLPCFDALISPAPARGAAQSAGTSPYAGLDATRFWRSGVAETNPLIARGLYRKRFDIAPETRIATAGSCFAQHIATNFRARGFSVLDKEPAPWSPDAELPKRYGYGIYSARYANIYTVRQLLQLLREATAQEPPPVLVWEKDGRFHDALRPGVEPGGLGSPEEVRAHRQAHLKAVRALFRQMEVFVFTMGLTEAWVDTTTDQVLPTCPGTIAGRFDPAIHVFKNFTHAEILEDYRAFRAELAAFNPGVKHLITVSPVPLTATASDQHVLVATLYSKSVLRAVAGQLYDECADVDYFPSYEIIAAHPSRGFFFEANQRSVSPAGVETVMRNFFDEHGGAQAGPQAAKSPASPASGAEKSGGSGRAASVAGAAEAAEQQAEELICEEILLEAFNK